MHVNLRDLFDGFVRDLSDFGIVFKDRGSFFLTPQLDGEDSKDMDDDDGNENEATPDQELFASRLRNGWGRRSLRSLISHGLDDGSELAGALVALPGFFFYSSENDFIDADIDIDWLADARR